MCLLASNIITATTLQMQTERQKAARDAMRAASGLLAPSALLTRVLEAPEEGT